MYKMKKRNNLWTNAVFILLRINVILLMNEITTVSAGRRYDYKSRYPIPYFTTREKNITVEVAGGTVILPCSVQNLGTRTVVWRKIPSNTPLTIGELPYISDSSFTVIHGSEDDSINWDLRISDVKPEDSGEYECQVASSDKTIRQKMRLLVKADTIEQAVIEPGIQIYAPEHIEKGEPLEIHCNATGALDALDWFRNGYKITTNFSNGIYIDKNIRLATKTISSTLHIARASMNDSGTYTCRTSARQVISAKVNVLSAGTKNFKRDEQQQTESVLIVAGMQGENSAAVIYINPLLYLTLLYLYFSSWT